MKGKIEPGRKEGNPLAGGALYEPLDENLGAVAVELTPGGLREINAAAANITVQGARLPQPSLELTRREAPLKK